MNAILSLALGYVLGAFNPAALLGKCKNVDLRKVGTKNLGASNTLLTLGRKAGALVMVLDIFKAFLASRIAKLLFPKLMVAGLLGGLGAVLGHVFPFHLHFRGGKGLAAFGGLVLAYNPWLFLFYLVVGCALMFLVNRSVFLPMFSAATFPLIVAMQTQALDMTLVAAAASVLVIVKHWSNLGKVKRGEDAPIRELFQTKVFRRK